MSHLTHETVNGHLLQRNWSNRKAKLQMESLQADLQQAKAQLAGIVFILLPFLAHAYSSKCHKVE